MMEYLLHCCWISSYFSSQDEDKSACLGDISDHVMGAGEELIEVTDEMADCISEVGKCQELVAWLKKLNGGFIS